MEALLFVIVVWVAPVLVAAWLGGRKGRSLAWLWGLLLGWLGVLVVALLADRRSLA